MSEEAYSDLVAAIQAHSGMEREQIIEAGEHGADAGWPGFTYTSDGADFTRANRSLVWRLLEEESDAFGFENAPAFVASFARADMANSEEGFDCLLSWYALETAGRWLAEHPEERNDEANNRAVARAGYLAGLTAGSWVIDGNTSEETIRALWLGLDDGDPATLDSLPHAPSGEWADDPTAEDLIADALDVEAETLDSEAADALWHEYTDAFGSGVVDEVEWVAGTHLGVLNPDRYPSADERRRQQMADEHVAMYCGEEQSA